MYYFRTNQIINTLKSCLPGKNHKIKNKSRIEQIKLSPAAVYIFAYSIFSLQLCANFPSSYQKSNFLQLLSKSVIYSDISKIQKSRVLSNYAVSQSAYHFFFFVVIQNEGIKFQNNEPETLMLRKISIKKGKKALMYYSIRPYFPLIYENLVG